MYMLRVDVRGPSPEFKPNFRTQYPEWIRPEIESNLTAQVKSLDRFGRLEIQFSNMNNYT